MQAYKALGNALTNIIQTFSALTHVFLMGALLSMLRLASPLPADGLDASGRCLVDKQVCRHHQDKL